MKGTIMKDVPLSSLENGLVQNPSRQSDVAVKILQESIEEVGLLTAILVKQRGQKLMIADGHRRAQAMRNLGWKEIRASVYTGPLTEAELWAAANGSTRGIRGADWFYGWAMEAEEGNSDVFLERMNKSTAAHIRSFVKLFGKSRSVEIGKTGKVSPVLQSFVALVHTSMSARLKDNMKLSAKQVGEWMVSHGSDIRKLIDTKPPIAVLRKLHTRMAKGEPFPRGDW